MKKKAFSKKTLFITVPVALTMSLGLAACGGNSKSDYGSQISTESTSLPVPSAVMAKAALSDSSTVKATLQIDGGAAQSMTISGGQATFSQTSLSAGQHTILITFYQTANGYSDNIVLATLSKNITITAGTSTPLAPSQSEYDLTADYDEDGVANYMDTDVDNDGLSDADENDIATNPFDDDTDDDKMNDAWEHKYQFDPKAVVPGLANADDDGDRFNNIQESQLDTSPNAANPAFTMIEVIAGTYVMGSNDAPNSQPEHNVGIQAFKVSETEITVRQFRIFAEETNFQKKECSDVLGAPISGGSWEDPGYRQTDDHPVTCVSWADAKAYAQWATTKFAGAEPPYRLLSESEWEYAAQGGTSTKYPWGDTLASGLANCDNGTCGDIFANTSPVKSFPMNGYGLYDMLGNANEWVEDCFNSNVPPNYSNTPTDGTAYTLDDCTLRPVRGGARHTGVGIKTRFTAGSVAQDTVGFRIAQDL